MMKKLACSVCALLCLFLNQTFACTTFCLVGKGEVLFGRNYDWTIGDALVLVNKRGDVTAKFTDYTRKANGDMIERSFNGTSFLEDTPAMARLYVASYPESFTCGSAK